MLVLLEPFGQLSVLLFEVSVRFCQLLCLLFEPTVEHGGVRLGLDPPLGLGL